MKTKKKERRMRQRSVAEKLEIIQARQKGLRLEEIKALYGIAHDTLFNWMKAYEENGVAGLERAGRTALAREPDTKVACAEQMVDKVLEESPRAGVGRVQGILFRHGFLKLAKETVRRLLRRKGKTPLLTFRRRRNKPPQIRTFERAKPNEMWQTDIMSFMLKGQYRVYLIGFMDDHSRFLVGWGLHRFQTADRVMEVFRAAIEKYGMPKEVLSDNGRQYYTWRGKSKFNQMLTKLGIRHIRSRPYHPQTLGKIESFWRNLFQECLSQLPMSSFEEAQGRIREYIEYYNYRRPHQGIGNVLPSDRFFGVAGQVREVIEENTARVEESASPLGEYRPPAYLVGNLGGKELRVVAKDAEVMLRDAVAKEEGDDERTESGETAESGGTVGVDSGGTATAGTDRAVVQAGGDIPGGVLPVDAPSPSCGDDGAGGGETGAEAVVAGESGGAGSTAEGENHESGEKDGSSAEGTGSPETGGGGTDTDHSEALVGTGSGERV